MSKDKYTKYNPSNSGSHGLHQQPPFNKEENISEDTANSKQYRYNYCFHGPAPVNSEKEN